MNHQTWDYHLEPLDDLTETRLNALGSGGWELVTTNDRTGEAIFKRVGPGFAERITIAQREQLDARMNTRDDDGSSS